MADPHEIQLSAGDEVDRYRILHELSAGGSGRVFAAKHQFLDRTVALKVMHVHDVARAGARARMQAEALVLSRIMHANVVRVHDAGLLPDGLFWIAMDLLKGQTLRQLMHFGGRVPIARALYYSAEIADGVEAAHEIGVVHRDLKPENVFVTEADEVKVLDLGTAKLQGYGTYTTDRYRVHGTLPYMSPEHCDGTPVDARTDIYALGVVLYEMMAGRHPFIHPDDPLPSPQELVTRHFVAEPTPLPELIEGFPAYVWRVVERAMRKKRDARYASMREFAVELRDVRHRALNAARNHQFRAHADGQLQQVSASSRPASLTPRMYAAAEAHAAPYFGPRGTFKMETLPPQPADEGSDAPHSAAALAGAPLAAAHGSRAPRDQGPLRAARDSQAPREPGTARAERATDDSRAGATRDVSSTPSPVASDSAPPSARARGLYQPRHAVLLGAGVTLAAAAVLVSIRAVAFLAPPRDGGAQQPAASLPASEPPVAAGASEQATQPLAPEHSALAAQAPPSTDSEPSEAEIQALVDRLANSASATAAASASAAPSSAPKARAGAAPKATSELWDEWPSASPEAAPAPKDTSARPPSPRPASVESGL